MEPNPQSTQPQSPSLIPSSSDREGIGGMELGFPAMDESESNALFDWGDLLDFAVEDDPLVMPLQSVLGSDEGLAVSEGFEESGDRVRKRDPKLTCENFLAGIVPCACPEMDALLAEEEELRGTGKKRARTARAAATATVTGVALRCQVPGCEVNISELKGYHKRHRVCLKCANASAIVIDGESKRYCQQCGKFHFLSDFDEGKRSCRRKLEIHNNRRRRKHTNVKGSIMEETRGDPLVEEIGCDIEASKAASVILKTKIAPHGALVISEDVHVANLCSTPGSQDTLSGSLGSDETNMDRTKNGSKYGPCSSNGDNKSAFSSVCPTGRISFKLYDWNPAEFPRRLRHQIFHWLASMPVELEGYIRPGCTILTVFLSMPRFMWVELFKDPASQLRDFISAPGRLLSGKGTIHVYLNNMRFLIASDGTFVKKVPADVLLTPRLHYVHPTFFEAGKPMEFVACGSNLLQPKFRFLVSFQEKYVASEGTLSFSPGQSKTKSCSFNHQTYMIYAPLTDCNAFGPAFIEVENESGLSNYIPVLVADKDVCDEMKRIQQKCVQSFHSKSSVCEDNCEFYMERYATLSEFVLDIAWLLKKPASESVQDNLTSSQIQRYDSVLNFLMCHDSHAILDRVLKSLGIRMGSAEKSSPGYATCEDGIRLLQKSMDQASNILRLKRSGMTVPTQKSLQNDMSENFIQYERTSAIPVEDIKSRIEHKCISMADSTSTHGCETVPLLCTDNSANMKRMVKWPRQSCSAMITSTRVARRTRATVSLAAIAIVCFGVCAVILHPHKVGQFAVTVRRCLFDRS